MHPEIQATAEATAITPFSIDENSDCISCSSWEDKLAVGECVFE
jgi:hypothetical protein